MGRDIIIREKKEESIENGNEQNVEDSFYSALSHEIRRKIINIMGSHDYTSFTALKKELKVSTGTIYHHLDSLSQLIEQHKNKKYYLSELGKIAYNSMKENIETLKSPDLTQREFESPLLKLLMYITPKKFIKFEEKDRVYNIIISLSILIIGTILCGVNGFYSVFLFYIKSAEEIYQLETIFHILLAVGYVINYIVYFLIVEFLCRVFYKKKQRTLDFFLSFPVILYPMVIYLFIHFIVLSTGLIRITFFRIMDVVLLIFFQIWSLWLLTYNISVNKELKIKESLIISLILHYSSFTIVLFISL